MDIYSAPATPNIILKGRVKWIHPVSAQTSVNLVLFVASSSREQGVTQQKYEIRKTLHAHWMDALYIWKIFSEVSDYAGYSIFLQVVQHAVLYMQFLLLLHNEPLSMVALKLMNCKWLLWVLWLSVTHYDSPWLIWLSVTHEQTIISMDIMVCSLGYQDIQQI